MSDDFQSIISYLTKEWESSKCFNSPRIGCNEEQIEELMKVQGVSYLPKVYIAFMSAFGLSSGGLHGSGEFVYSHTLKFKAIWSKLTNIPTNSFIFYADTPLFALLFQTEMEEDDPQLYRIAEGPLGTTLEVSKYDELLSDFIIDWITTEINTCNR